MATLQKDSDGDYDNDEMIDEKPDSSCEPAPPVPPLRDGDSGADRHAAHVAKHRKGK